MAARGCRSEWAFLTERRVPGIDLLVSSSTISGSVTFRDAGRVAVLGGNPLLLTTIGEFVVKDAVLAAALIAIAGRGHPRPGVQRSNSR